MSSNGSKSISPSPFDVSEQSSNLSEHDNKSDTAVDKSELLIDIKKHETFTTIFRAHRDKKGKFRYSIRRKIASKIKGLKNQESKQSHLDAVFGNVVSRESTFDKWSRSRSQRSIVNDLGSLKRQRSKNKFPVSAVLISSSAVELPRARPSNIVLVPKRVEYQTYPLQKNSFIPIEKQNITKSETITTTSSSSSSSSSSPDQTITPKSTYKTAFVLPNHSKVGVETTIRSRSPSKYTNVSMKNVIHIISPRTNQTSLAKLENHSKRTIFELFVGPTPKSSLMEKSLKEDPDSPIEKSREKSKKKPDVFNQFEEHRKFLLHQEKFLELMEQLERDRARDTKWNAIMTIMTATLFLLASILCLVMAYYK